MSDRDLRASFCWVKKAIRVRRGAMPEFIDFETDADPSTFEGHFRILDSSVHVTVLQADGGIVAIPQDQPPTLEVIATITAWLRTADVPADAS